MNFEIKNENERCYTPKYGVPTIQLGDGGTTISDVIGADGFHGVCFSESITNGDVGEDRTDQIGGLKVDEAGTYLQIITKNPASIDVLIDKLQRAKAALLSEDEEE